MQTDIAVIDANDTLVTKILALPESRQAKVLEFIESFDILKKTIWDKLDDRLKNVPQDELAAIPADASANIEHYLYGAPKK